MYDDVNQEYVKVKNSEREQNYEANVWDELVEPRRELGGKSRLEAAGYRYEVIEDEREAEKAAIAKDKADKK